MRRNLFDLAEMNCKFKKELEAKRTHWAAMRFWRWMNHVLDAEFGATYHVSEERSPINLEIIPDVQGNDIYDIQ